MSHSAGSSSAALLKLERTLDRLFLSLLALSPLAIGGVPPKLQAALAVAALAVGLPILALASLRGDNKKPHLLVWALLGLAAWTLIRDWHLLAPLGSAPHRAVAQLWPDLKLGLLLAPAYGPLFALRTGALAVTIHVATARFRAADRRDAVGLAILAASGLAISVALLQAMIGADKIFGLYELEHRRYAIPLAGPYPNHNMATTLYALGPLLAIGWAHYRSKHSTARLAWLMLFISALIAAQLETRAALVAMIGGLALTLAAMSFSWRELSKPKRLMIVAAPLIILVAYAFLLLSVIPSSLSGALNVFFFDFGKTQVWYSLWSVFSLAPWVGIGPGAQQELLPWVSGDLNNLLFHSESMPLQALIDHGVLWTLVIFGALLYPLFHAAAARTISAKRLALLIASLFYIAAEAIGGMSMHGLAYSLLVGAWWGSQVPVPSRKSRAASERSGERAAILNWIFVSAAALTALMSLTGLSRSFPWVELETVMPLTEELKGAEGDLSEALATQRGWVEALPANNDLIGQSLRLALMSGDRARAEQLLSYLTDNVPYYPSRGRLKLIMASDAGDTDEVCDALNVINELGRPLARADFQLLGHGTTDWRSCLERYPSLWELAYEQLRSDDDSIHLMSLAEAQLADTPDHLPSLAAVTRRAIRNSNFVLTRYRGRAWLNNAPDDLDARYHLATATLRLGDADEAWRLLDESRQELLAQHPMGALRYLELSARRLESIEDDERALHEEIAAIREGIRGIEPQLRGAESRIVLVQVECSLQGGEFSEARRLLDHYEERYQSSRVTERLRNRIDERQLEWESNRRLYRRSH